MVCHRPGVGWVGHRLLLGMRLGPRSLGRRNRRPGGKMGGCHPKDPQDRHFCAASPSFVN
jgi:hypothetical protein